MTDLETKIKFRVQVNKRARAFLEQLDRLAYKKILNKILILETEPRPTGSIKLSVIDGYRIKWGDYGILYTIDYKNKIVYVYDIKHRKDVYRKR